MARAIFISYRRTDSEGEAGRLFDDLVRAFGEDSVFMDVPDISPGLDFRQAIDDNVASCGVLLAVIGPQWVTATDRSGKRRIDDDSDFVRLEAASALARKIPVIPVLVYGARQCRNRIDLPHVVAAYADDLQSTPDKARRLDSTKYFSAPSHRLIGSSVRGLSRY